MEWVSLLTTWMLLLTHTYGYEQSRLLTDCNQQCPSKDRNRGPTTPYEAQTYLVRFGYLSVFDLWDSDGNQVMREAIKTFQQIAHINQTGTLDNDTYVMLQKGRCGNLDVQRFELPDIPSNRKKRFVFSGLKWMKTHLTYRIMNYSPDVTREDIDSTIAAAFKMWEDVTPLTFTPSTCSPVDITLSFLRGDHGDGTPFDGPGGTYGHAFRPSNGTVHFDEDENWTLDLEPGINGMNLHYTAVHEIGHSLGLEHSTVLGSIMAPIGMPTGEMIQLHEDDIEGIQEVYGTPDDVNPIEFFPETNCSTTESPRITDRTTQPTTPIMDDPFLPTASPTVQSTLRKTVPTTMTITTTTAKPTTLTQAVFTTRITTLSTTLHRSTTTIPEITPKITPTSSSTRLVTATPPKPPTHIVKKTTTTVPRTTTENRQRTIKILHSTRRWYDFFTRAPRTEPTEPPCSGRVDAITQTLDRHIFAFRGNQVYLLKGTGVDSEYPKSIKSVFPGGPERVHAAMTLSFDVNWRSKGYVYLIHGKQVWRYWQLTHLSGYRLDRGFPTSLQKHFNLCDEGSRIDAIYSERVTKRGMSPVNFFSGDTYAKVLFDSDGRLSKTRSCYGWTKRQLDSLPLRVDAAFRQSSTSKGYFFSGECYFRLSSKDVMGPRDTGYWWFGCPKRNTQTCGKITKTKKKSQALQNW